MSLISAKDIIQSLLSAGDTQAEIEKGSGVSQATISRILNGEHQDPKSSTVNKLAAYAATRLQPAA